MKHSVPYIKWRNNIISYVPEERRIGDDFIVIGEGERWDPGKEPFMADVTQALIYTRGSAKITINMIEYSIIAPAMVVILPDVVVKYNVFNDDVDSFAIVMSRKFTDSLFSDASMTTPLRMQMYQNPVKNIKGEEEAFKLYRELLLTLLKSKDCSNRLEAAKHLTLTFFYGYTRTSQNNPLERGLTRSEQIADKFLRMVQGNYREKRELSFYSDGLCITSKYLSTAVKDATGKTASDWIDDYLISEAKALLSSTELTVDQISIRFNFNSQALFGKYFKRVTGMSPREYRKKL